MAFRQGLLRENQLGIATVIGAMGIGLIVTSGAIHVGYAARAKTKN